MHSVTFITERQPSHLPAGINCKQPFSGIDLFVHVPFSARFCLVLNCVGLKMLSQTPCFFHVCVCAIFVLYMCVCLTSFFFIYYALFTFNFF